ncbi:hypothetical protein CRYUN_Cryun17cG0079600 [Craigia yunnanensis]
MEGRVEHKFDMKPHEENIEEYGRLCRERTNKSMIKNRQIQVIDNDRGVHMRPMPGMIGLISSNPKDKKKTTPVKQSDVKRTRRDRGELEDIMFKLFERQPNWALKQLVQETDQPAVSLSLFLISSSPYVYLPVRVLSLCPLTTGYDLWFIMVFHVFEVFALLSLQQFLKEILNELCVYNKRGTNQGTYELKPEYKKSVEDTGAE